MRFSIATSDWSLLSARISRMRSLIAFSWDSTNRLGVLMRIATDSRRWRNSFCTRCVFSSRAFRSSARATRVTKGHKRARDRIDPVAVIYLVIGRSAPPDWICSPSRWLSSYSRWWACLSDRSCPSRRPYIAFPGTPSPGIIIINDTICNNFMDHSK